MIYVLFGMSLLFVAIGFMVKADNAQYLLSGYNTMSGEDKKKVDLNAYIPYLRRFHIFLGVSLFTIGAALTYLINENAGGIFLAVYPILAYVYLVAISSKYSKGVSTKTSKAGLAVLAGAVLFVAGLLGYGFKENPLYFDSGQATFTGSYGETLAPSEIQSIELVDQLPEIAVRTNGFALGTIRKGYFKTKKGETIKLILNSDNQPIILFSKTNGQKIYYSAKARSNEEVVNEMKKTLPNMLFK